MNEAMAAHNHEGNVWSFRVQVKKFLKIYRCTYCTSSFEVKR